MPEGVKMKRPFLLTLFILTVSLAGLAVPAYSQLPKYLYGIISFYSDDYAGKTTASGETYDPEQLTAAHQTLPFGTEVDVENLENGKKVRVRIIDRGPFTDSRILDVSRKAADQLGFSKKGTVYSKITLVKIGDNKIKKASSTASSAAPVFDMVTGDKIVEAASSRPAQVNTVSASSSSIQATVTAVNPIGVSGDVPVKVNTITRTNTATLYQTNQVELTNYSDMTRTNIVDIPPYEEKFIERPVEDRKISGTPLPNDDFILDEPVDSFVADTGAKEKNIPEITDNNIGPLEPELPIPDENTVTSPEHVFEKNGHETGSKDLVPDTLLPNEEAITVEKSESQGEALKEIGGAAGGRFVVQAGAFRDESRALRFYDTLRGKGFQVFTAEAKVRGKKWFRVRIGYFDTIGPAKAVMDRLKTMRIKPTLVIVKK
jgi:rare lipoprotein A